MSLPAGEARARASVASRLLPWAIAAAAVVALGTVLVFNPQGQSDPQGLRPLVRLDVDLGQGVSLPAPSAQAARSIAISPDGTRLVYVSGSPTKLFVRPLDQPVATELAGTEGALAPFFSPDGQWLGFLARHRLHKVSSNGGAVVPLADKEYLGAAWGEDDSIFLGGLPKAWRLPAAGGTAEAIAEARDGELSLREPEVLPGGKAVLLTADKYGGADQSTIEVLTLADGRRRTLVQGGASPRYLATGSRSGYLVYVSGATLFAIPFDPVTLETRGTAVPVADDVSANATTGSGQFDISRTGTLIYVKARPTASIPMRLEWHGPRGAIERAPLAPGAYTQVSVSPTGSHLALTVTDEGAEGAVGRRRGVDIWVYDLRRDVLSRLTTGGLNSFPTWSPDGTFIVFLSLGRGLFQVRADGGSAAPLLVQSTLNLYPGSFTPDGTRLAYSIGRRHLWTVPIAKDGRQLKAGTPELFIDGSAATYRSPTFSPDGRWLAYQSDETGTDEVFVRPFTATPSAAAGRWQISSGGGTLPRWSPKGDTLLYSSDGAIKAVAYTTRGEAFVAEKPRAWAMAGPGLSTSPASGAAWDVSPDGRQVATLVPVESITPTAEHVVTFLQNFFDELRRKAPLE